MSFIAAWGGPHYKRMMMIRLMMMPDTGGRTRRAGQVTGRSAAYDDARADARRGAGARPGRTPPRLSAAFIAAFEARGLQVLFRC